MRLHQKRKGMHKEILRNSGEQRGRENIKFMKYVRMHQKTIKNAPKNDDYFIGNHSL